MNQENAFYLTPQQGQSETQILAKLQSQELNDMALQPSCALWKLHIAAGDSPGAFLLPSVCELYVQR